MATLNVADKTTLDAVYDKIGSMSGSFVPPLTSNATTNPTTTYTTASAVSTVGETTTLSFSGAKNIYGVKFLTTSKVSSGKYNKLVVTIDGTSIELTMDETAFYSSSTSNSDEVLLCWLGDGTNRVRFCDVHADYADTLTVLPVQIKCNSSVSFAFTCSSKSDSETSKLRCQILYTK